MIELGAPMDIVNELKQEQKIYVFPINWPVVVWFNEVCDLMRYRASDGACLGLDLVQVKAESKMGHREYSNSDFSGLRIMSKVVAQTINEIS